MNVVSFFAGCGGLDLGFEKAGIESFAFTTKRYIVDRVLNILCRISITYAGSQIAYCSATLL